MLYLLLGHGHGVGGVDDIEPPHMQVEEVEHQFLAIVIQRPQHYVILSLTHIDAV